jgi:Xaa-Pro aminopeptidase
MASKRPQTGSDGPAARRRKALRRCAAQEADSLLVSRPEDVRYLTGFTGDDSVLLLAKGSACLITDGRYDEQSREECPDLEICIRKGPMTTAITDWVRARSAARLGVQAEHVTVSLLGRLRRGLRSRKTVPVTGLVSALRVTKDDSEVRAIRRAVRAAEQAFRELLGEGRRGFVGKSERAIAARLDYRMRLAGASGPSFETIVAAGAHGSLPHYRPGSTVVRKGDPVLIDWGAKVGGYCSDLTRVVFAGRIPPEIARIYEVVLRAQRAGAAAIRPGVRMSTVDRAARNVIAGEGFGDKFVHSLGHGIGLEIHEAPGLARSATGRMRSGMVVTVEPGIYLPGVGGVRIEDDVLVTPQGARKLSSLPRDIAAMTLQ